MDGDPRNAGTNKRRKGIAETSNENTREVKTPAKV
jgi:hypothetical protein